MKGDLDPHAVAARLERLRSAFTPELAEAVARRLAAERPLEPSFAEAARRRLDELRALCELSDYLQRRPEK